MSDVFRSGSKVTWKWGKSTATGKVVEVYHESVTKTIKGKEITREASKSEPAYLIEQEDGDQVLKSKSEIERA